MRMRSFEEKVCFYFSSPGSIRRLARTAPASSSGNATHCKIIIIIIICVVGRSLLWQSVCARAMESGSPTLKENIMAPRNKTKLAHCLIICVCPMVCVVGGGGRRHCREAHFSTFVPLSFFASTQVFSFIIIFLCFSCCLSHSFYYLPDIIDTMYIFYYCLLVCGRCRRRRRCRSPDTAVVTISHRSHRWWYLCSQFFLSPAVIIPSLVLPSYQFSLSFLLHFASLTIRLSKREKSSFVRFFFLWSLCSLFIIIYVSSIDSISWYAHSTQLTHTHSRSSHATRTSCQTEKRRKNP